jgi:TPR repeat protein
VTEPKPNDTPIAETAVPARARLSPDAIKQLVTRGDALIGNADVASARLFYERAAEAGDGPAALRLGETYDPQFLARVRLGRVIGDPGLAVQWYRRARELGVIEAGILLSGIENNQ